MPDDFRYYFLHIPKTAGCTMAYRLLPKFFDSDRICPHTSFAALQAAPAEERERYRLFHGHFNAHLEHFVAGKLRIITLLRHPFERAISQYRYILSSVEHPLHAQVVASPDFGAYLRNRDLFCPNSLTLALGSRIDPDLVLRRARWRGRGTDTIDALIDDETFNTVARRCHAEAATALLDRCALVGLQEEMSKTATLLHRHFGRNFSGPVDFMNESGGDLLTRDDLPADALADLAALHEHDLDVYAYGKALFERHWAEASGNVLSLAKPASAKSGSAKPGLAKPSMPTLEAVKPRPAGQTKRPAPPSRLYYMTLPWSGDVDLASQLIRGYQRPSEVCPAWNYDGLMALPPHVRAEYAAFHGYFFWPLDGFIGGTPSIVTFLGDPIERALLQYQERLADRYHKLHLRVRSKRGLGDFVRDPLAFTPNVLTLSLARRFTPRDMEQLKAQALAQGTSLNDVLGDYIVAKPATPRDLARAKRRLEQSAFIGFTETFDTSLAALGRQLDWPEIGQSITASLRQELSRRATLLAMLPPTDRALIRQVNALDAELYDFARSLNRQVRQAGRSSFARARDWLLSRQPALRQAAD
jgi:hypothetical protein